MAVYDFFNYFSVLSLLCFNSNALSFKYGKEVHVSNANQFRAAIRNNITIIVNQDIYVSAPLLINNKDDVTIIGNDSKVDGQLQSQCFYIKESTVVIKQLSMVNCIANLHDTEATGGGAIYLLFGELSLYSCQILNCSAWGSYPFGGGMMVDSGTVNIYHSLFQECGTVIGGGIASIFGNVHIENSTMINNEGGYGAGICMFVSGIVHIRNCFFIENTAELYGGGLYLGSSTVASVNNTLFYNNSATQVGGGAALLDDSVSKFDQCDFISNSAYRSGGGIYAEGSDVEISYNIMTTTSLSTKWNLPYSVTSSSMLESIESEGCCFVDNTALFDGGAVFISSADDVDSVLSLVGNITLTKNKAGRNGGAMFLYDTLLIDETISLVFTLNRAGFESETGGSGGAMFYHIEEGFIYFSKTQFINNTCSQNGGAILIEMPLAIPHSDMLSCETCAEESEGDPLICQYIPKNSTWRQWNHTVVVIFSEMLFESNAAIGSGGSGGAVSITNGYLHMISCLFKFNVAHTIGGAVYLPRAQYSESTSEVIISNTLFQSNYVLFGKGDEFYSESAATIMFQSNTWFQVHQEGSQVQYSSSSDVEFESSGQVIFSTDSGIICPAGFELTQPVLIEPFLSFPLPGWNNTKCLSSNGPCSRYFESCWPPMLLQALSFNCTKCASGSYSFDQGAMVGGQVQRIQCFDTPYGGECLNGGSDLMARAGFYGSLVSNKKTYDDDPKSEIMPKVEIKNNKVLFVQCPDGYCCEREKELCPWNNSCAGHRTGTLCGKCKQGYSLSLLGVDCVNNRFCSWTLSLFSMEVIKSLLYCILFYFTPTLGIASPFALVAFYDQFYNLLSNDVSKHQQTVSMVSFFFGSTSSSGLQGKEGKGDRPMCAWIHMQPITRAFVPYLDILVMMGLLFMAWVLGLLLLQPSLNNPTTTNAEDSTTVEPPTLVERSVEASTPSGPTDDSNSRHHRHQQQYRSYADRNGRSSLLASSSTKYEMHSVRIIGAFAQALNFSIGELASASTALLTCTNELRDNKSRLLIDGDIICYTNWQIIIMVFMIVFIIFLTIPLIFEFIYIFGHYNHSFAIDQFCDQYILNNRFLSTMVSLFMEPFKKKNWYWLSVMIWQRIALAILHVSVNLNETSRSLWAIMICILCLVFHSISQPFKKEYHEYNMIQTMLLACTVIVAALNLVPSDIVTNAMNTSHTMDNEVDSLAEMKTYLLIFPISVVLIWWFYKNRNIILDALIDVTKKFQHYCGFSDRSLSSSSTSSWWWQSKRSISTWSSTLGDALLDQADISLTHQDDEGDG